MLVDDIHAATKKAKDLGARIIKDVHEVPNTGWLSLFLDPTGAVLGLWKPMNEQITIPLSSLSSRKGGEGRGLC